MIMLDILNMNVGFIISSHYTSSQVRVSDEKSFIKETERSVNIYLYIAEFEIFAVTKRTNTLHPTDGGRHSGSLKQSA